MVFVVAAVVAVILCVVVIAAAVVTANMSRIPNLPLLLFLVLLMDVLCTCPGFISSACCTRQTDRQTDRQTAIFVYLRFRR